MKVSKSPDSNAAQLMIFDCTSGDRNSCLSDRKVHDKFDMEFDLESAEFCMDMASTCRKLTSLIGSTLK